MAELPEKARRGGGARGTDDAGHPTRIPPATAIPKQVSSSIAQKAMARQLGKLESYTFFSGPISGHVFNYKRSDHSKLTYVIYM